MKKIVLLGMAACGALLGSTYGLKCLKPTQGVTYEFASRFGDNLLTYLHAQWIAYKYGIPLVYRKFEYSKDLVLDETRWRFGKRTKKWTKKPVERGIISNPREKNTLYFTPYFPENKQELALGGWSYFPVDWKDKKFRKIVRKAISPKKELTTTLVLKDHINIAVHVREGGGYDPQSVHYGWPQKFPPMSFYAEGLSKALELFKGKAIYCYVFTDALDPKSIVEKLQSSLENTEGVTFDYRKEGNHHQANVLEDFFSLMKFDVLVRPESNFSMVASLINDYAVLVSPESFTYVDDQPIIDKLNITIDNELVKKLLKTKKAV